MAAPEPSQCGVCTPTSCQRTFAFVPLSPLPVNAGSRPAVAKLRGTLPEDQRAAFWVQVGVGRGLCDCGTVSTESGPGGALFSPFCREKAQHFFATFLYPAKLYFDKGKQRIFFVFVFRKCPLLWFFLQFLSICRCKPPLLC